MSVIKYESNPVHRNNTPKKTQWNRKINAKEEERIFYFGYTEEWCCSQGVFSLKLNNDKPKYLDNDLKLKYARFIGSSNIWHGWPANGKRSVKDIPDYDILEEWEDKEYTTRAKIMKLRGRKRCTI